MVLQSAAIWISDTLPGPLWLYSLLPAIHLYFLPVSDIAEAGTRSMRWHPRMFSCSSGVEPWIPDSQPRALCPAHLPPTSPGHSSSGWPVHVILKSNLIPSSRPRSRLTSFWPNAPTDFPCSLFSLCFGWPNLVRYTFSQVALESALWSSKEGCTCPFPPFHLIASWGCGQHLINAFRPDAPWSRAM